MRAVRLPILAGLLAVAALWLLPAAAPALTAQEKYDLARQKLGQARKQIDAAKQKKAALSTQIAGLDGRLTAIDTALAHLDEKIAGVQEEFSATQEKLSVLQAELALKRAELDAAEKKLALEQEYFAQRVVITYKSDQLTYIDVVLDSTDFEDFVSRMEVVKDLIAGDNDLVAELQSTRDEVEREKQVIAQKEGAVHKVVSDLQDQNDQLAALQAAKAAQQQEALAMRQQKQGALSQVAGDLAELERQEDELLSQSQALAGIISGAGSTGHGTGTLSWPVSGPVLSPFGWRMHPIFHVRKFHTGIDIGVGYGVPIHAADSGTVIYATWMSGYGNTIVVDHGGGISTLYAHQSSLAVGYGATVAGDQVIGYVGSTGYSTGPHLHFEVRQNGNPVDPLAYLP